jgi:hypothetical protein
MNSSSIAAPAMRQTLMFAPLRFSDLLLPHIDGSASIANRQLWYSGHLKIEHKPIQPLRYTRPSKSGALASKRAISGTGARATIDNLL